MTEIVNVGPFAIMKALPANTQLMAAWGAIWTFGGTVKRGHEYVKPIPVIRDNHFWVSIDPRRDVATPDTFVALVVELRTIEKATRTSQKTFPAVRHKVVATTEGKAWIVPGNAYYAASRPVYTGFEVSGHGPAVDLSKLPSFNLIDIVGENEFKKMVSSIKTNLRKL